MDNRHPAGDDRRRAVNAETFLVFGDGLFGDCGHFFEKRAVSKPLFRGYPQTDPPPLCGGVTELLVLRQNPVVVKTPLFEEGEPRQNRAVERAARPGAA